MLLLVGSGTSLSDSFFITLAYWEEKMMLSPDGTSRQV